jgi:hypothetical protein
MRCPRSVPVRIRERCKIGLVIGRSSTPCGIADSLQGLLAGLNAVGFARRCAELQEEQLALHQQATVEAAAAAKVTIESLIAEAEAARAKAMSEKGGAAAAVSALTAKAKLAGMWREKVDQHNTVPFTSALSV